MDYRITVAIIIVTLLVWLGWDSYVYFYRGDVEATFSRIIYRTASTMPLIPLAIGILLGHLFWPQTPKDEEKKP
jgi:hypothetical protein